jgi:hypothetical protein
MAVNQCSFDPYRAGTKVYRAYQASGRPGRAAHPIDNPSHDCKTLIFEILNSFVSAGWLTSYSSSFLKLKQYITINYLILRTGFGFCIDFAFNLIWIDVD